MILANLIMERSSFSKKGLFLLTGSINLCWFWHWRKRGNLKREVVASLNTGFSSLWIFPTEFRKCLLTNTWVSSAQPVLQRCSNDKCFAWAGDVVIEVLLWWSSAILWLGPVFPMCCETLKNGGFLVMPFETRIQPSFTFFSKTSSVSNSPVN